MRKTDYPRIYRIWSAMRKNKNRKEKSDELFRENQQA